MNFNKLTLDSKETQQPQTTSDKFKQPSIKMSFPEITPAPTASSEVSGSKSTLTNFHRRYKIPASTMKLLEVFYVNDIAKPREEAGQEVDREALLQEVRKEISEITIPEMEKSIPNIDTPEYKKLDPMIKAWHMYFNSNLMSIFEVDVKKISNRPPAAKDIPKQKGQKYYSCSLSYDGGRFDPEFPPNVSRGPQMSEIIKENEETGEKTVEATTWSIIYILRTKTNPIHKLIYQLCRVIYQVICEKVVQPNMIALRMNTFRCRYPPTNPKAPYDESLALGGLSPIVTFPKDDSGAYNYEGDPRIYFKHFQYKSSSTEYIAPGLDDPIEWEIISSKTITYIPYPFFEKIFSGAGGKITNIQTKLTSGILVDISDGRVSKQREEIGAAYGKDSVLLEQIRAAMGNPDSSPNPESNLPTASEPVQPIVVPVTETKRDSPPKSKIGSTGSTSSISVPQVGRPTLTESTNFDLDSLDVPFTHDQDDQDEYQEGDPDFS